MGEGVTLRVERDMIDITSIGTTKPDPEWRYTDHRGHEHRWVGDTLPTLVTVEDTGWWCADCREQHTEYHLACHWPECREVVAPGVLPDPGPHHLPGPTRWYLDDQPITEAEANTWMEAHGG